MASIILDSGDASRSAAPGFASKVAAIALLGLLLATLYPLGYVGGGADDGRYLEAARCIAANGYCVPANHWAARLPLVLPGGTMLSLFGESRAVLALVPIAYALGSLLLFACLVRRVAGERAALIASLALIGTPVFISRWPRLTADIPELFFLLAALSLLLAAVRRDQAGLAVAGGAAMGLAVFSRTTAIAAAPILVVGLVQFTRQPVKWTALLALGGAGLLAAEALLHALTSGRPLLSWELALAHTRIPTTALPSSVDLGASPLLNPDYIANWHRGAGIQVHWLVDGALNLFADPRVALTLWSALMLAAAARIESARRRAPVGKLGVFLVAAAAAYFFTLTYVLAVHPTARMFMPLACVAAFAIGALARSPFVIPLLTAMILLTAGIGLRSADLSAHQDEAERWVRGSAEPLTISRTAASAFALSAPLSRLPRGRAADRPMIGITPGCDVEPPRLMRRFVHRPAWPIAERIGLTPRPLTLCLISPAPSAATAPSRSAPPAGR